MKEVENILKSNLPVYKKHEMIRKLYDEIHGELAIILDMQNSEDPYLTLAHEYGHIIDPILDKINFWQTEDFDNKNANYLIEYLQLLGKINNTRADNHAHALWETYADLASLRYELNQLGIYDSRNPEVFTKDHLTLYKSRSKTPNRLLKLFDEDTIVNIMNTFANNSYHARNKLYAKQGGTLNYLNYFK